MIKDPSLKVVDLSVEALVPNENNTNEMNEKQLDRLAEEIRENGFIQPIQAIPMDDGKYLILGGEHRWRAAKACGMTYIPAVIMTDSRWTDRDLVDLETFKLNAIHGNVNMTRFYSLYERMAIKFGPEKLQNVLGVDDDKSWKSLTKTITKTLKETGASAEAIDKIEKAAKKAKSPDALSRQISLILQAEQQASKTLAFFHANGAEHVVFQITPEMLQALKKISALGMDINPHLEPVLVSIADALVPAEKFEPEA